MIGRVRKMLSSIFARPKHRHEDPPAPPCENHEHTAKEKELVDRAHEVATRLHILEFMTMPDFDEIAAAAKARREQKGESSDG